MAVSRILGIDPGTRVTGFAVIDNTGLRGGKPIDVGVIKFNPNLNYQQRIVSLHTTVGQLASEHSPDMAIVEKAFFGINASSALKLGEARGAIFIALANNNVPVFEVSPTQVKKFITGSGHATKQQIATAIANLFQITLPKASADATDALAVAFCHRLVE